MRGRARLGAAAHLALVALCVAPQAHGQGDAHEHHRMAGDATGFVMNENRTELPRGCAAISGEHAFTVRAGTRYAKDHPGFAFGMSEHEYPVKPCSRVTVTFVNDDEVRHQWMVHGLPSYLYSRGMFSIEVSGGHEKTGTFIVPSDDRTYLVHCDMAQHMEKGMKGQLVVGEGSGNLPSIPGVSETFEKDTYVPGRPALWVAGGVLAGGVLAVAGFLVSRRRGGRP